MKNFGSSLVFLKILNSRNVICQIHSGALRHGTYTFYVKNMAYWIWTILWDIHVFVRFEFMIALPCHTSTRASKYLHVYLFQFLCFWFALPFIWQSTSTWMLWWLLVKGKTHLKTKSLSLGFVQQICCSEFDKQNEDEIWTIFTLIFCCLSWVAIIRWSAFHRMMLLQC